MKMNEKIEIILGRKRIRKSDLAHNVGITYRAFANYMNGSRKPRPSTLSKIAEELQVSTEFLLDDSQELELTVEERFIKRVCASDADKAQAAQFLAQSRGTRYMGVNRALNTLLRRTVCAHELGHDMLHRELSSGGIRENTLFLSHDKTEREANLFAAEILISDSEALSVLEYSHTLDEAAFELGALPEILGYKLELLNHKGHSFNLSDIPSKYLK